MIFSKKEKIDASRVTAVLISFLRPEFTVECIRSLKESYPDIHIIVAENAEYNPELEDFILSHGGQYHMMPFDSGVCYARNRLVEKVKTEYVLVGDDDFYYLPDPGLKKMIDFLDAREDVSLIGGRVSERGRTLNYQGYIDIYSDHLDYRPFDPLDCMVEPKSKVQYRICDITFNFFLARTKDIVDQKWDENIKVAFEHSDWFITVKKAGLKVAYTPEVTVVHKPQHVAVKEARKYMGFRMRRSDKDYFFEKHHIKYTIGFNGLRTENEKISIATSGGNMREIKRYYAKRTMSFDGKTYNAGDVIETDQQPNELMVECW